jgi:hypothetical protein
MYSGVAVQNVFLSTHISVRRIMEFSFNSKQLDEDGRPIKNLHLDLPPDDIKLFLDFVRNLLSGRKKPKQEDYTPEV